MSSINQFPTFQYSQPSEYHFSHDSVFLAREVFNRHSDQLELSDVQILDLCAGCGIVGMDLIFHQMKEKTFSGEVDFLEVQNVYETHFEKNKATMQTYFPDQILRFNWQNQNYAQPAQVKKYDLIMSNPPYFILGQGALSPSDFKNRCRFFIDSDWQGFINFLKRSLKPHGRAYFLVREDLKKVMSAQFADILFPFQVRGTWVGHIDESKKSDQ